MKDFSKWIAIALHVEIVARKKPSAGWHYFYGLRSSHDIGAADHAQLQHEGPK